MWIPSNRFDKEVLPLADRHYNRQKPGSPQFVPPGKCLVLKTPCRRALWVTSWPKYAQHEWRGAWINTLFRNEGAGLSSELIFAAILASIDKWPDIPDKGMVTFVDASRTRNKRDPGRCYRKAGFKHVGYTKKGLYVLQWRPDWL